MNKVLFYSLLSFIICISVTSRSQTISLVKDITPGSGSTGISSFKEAGGHLFFLNFKQLYVTDGTAAGTVLLKNFPSILSEPVAYKNKLFFAADDSIHGYELWMSDGTVAGTQLVKDIFPGPQSGLEIPLSGTFHFEPFNNELYFFANDSIHGREIWHTDGTSGGTALFTDLNPAPGGGIYSDYLKATSNKLFFDLEDSSGFPHPWYTDGTISGTQQASQVETGGSVAMTLGDKFFFDGFDTVFGVRLWVTDGTTANTHAVTGSASSNSYLQAFSPVVMSNKLYFFISGLSVNNVLQLYVSDGSAAGTALIKDSVHPSIMGVGTMLSTYNGRLYFGNSTAAEGQELWTSDGTPQGTALFKDIIPGTFTNSAGSLYPYSSSPFYETIATGHLFFKIEDTARRPQICISDGTASSTHVITYPGATFGGSSPLAVPSVFKGPLYTFNNQLFFTNIYDTTVGKELYKIGLNGTSVITVSSNSKEISVYPNPSSGSFTVQLNDQDFSQLQVYDQVGRIVYTQSLQPAQQQVSISIKGITPGIYYLQLKGKDGMPTKKIVIQQ
ncbi:ELWxxDGT repeat protein [Chitinophagaceae bacterium MMS25-I14]